MTITLILRHLGPGPHPSGTPQAVHAGEGGGTPVPATAKQAQAVAVDELNFKTSEEADNYAESHGLAKVSYLRGLKPEVATEVIRTLSRLTETCGPGILTGLTTMDRGGWGVGYARGELATNSAGKREMRLNVDYFNDNTGPDDRYNENVVDWPKRRDERAAANLEALRSGAAGESREDIEFEIADEAKYSRYSVDKPGTGVSTTVVHEFGHAVLMAASGRFTDPDEFLTKWYDVCLNMLKDGAQYKVSAYGSAIGDQMEMFAECFAMYMLGEGDQLPKYTVDFIESAIRTARGAR